MRIFASMQRRQLHVLIFPKWYPHSADPQNGSFIAHYARKLSLQHKVSVVFPVPVDEETPPDVREDGNLLEIRIPYVQSLLLWTPIRKLINYTRFRNAVNQGVVQMLAQREPPDLIHAQVLIRPALFASRLSQHWEIPWLLTEHSSDFLRKNAMSKIKHRIIRQLCGQAAFLVTVSSPLAEKLQSITGRTVEVIPNLISFNTIKKTPAPRDVIHIAVIADLVDSIKNISGILNALARIKEKIPPFKLTIVGDGRDGAFLKSLTADLELREVVDFIGRKEQPEVMEFLAEIDFLITNSRIETFSIVSAEAIASGKPVIVTRCGGPDQWFRPGYGKMIDADDPAQLESAIVEMCTSFKSYDAAEMAREIREQFDPELVMTRYEDLYRQMTGL